MYLRQFLLAALAAMLSIMIYGGAAQAQATRTWVSGVGEDTNPCTRAAPCKTFAEAISKTVANGEISVLDPGGFGGVTITKSINIVADGQHAGMLVAGSSAITINAGPNDVVRLKGLIIEGLGSIGNSTNGIRVLAAKSVYVTDTVINGFTNTASGCGVSVASTTSSVRVYLRNVEITNNRVGVCVTGTGGVNNAILLENSTLEGNTANSMALNGSSAAANVFASVLVGAAISLSGGAQLISSGNNRIAGAVGPTSVQPLQ